MQHTASTSAIARDKLLRGAEKLQKNLITLRRLDLEAMFIAPKMFSFGLESLLYDIARFQSLPRHLERLNYNICGKQVRNQDQKAS